MTRFNKLTFRPDSTPFQMIIGIVFALLLGLTSLWLSPMLVLGVLVATLSAYVMIKRPEIGLLGILLATSSVIAENQLPLLSFGISFHVPDFLLIGTLGLILVRWLADPKFVVVHTPIDMPLLVFYGVTLLSTMVALGQGSVEIEVVRRTIRILTYYLAFFVVTNLVRERKQINLLISGLFALATFVATAMVAQFLLGDGVKVLPGRVEALNTQGTMYEDVTRILPPGWPIILLMFVVGVCTLIMDDFMVNTWWRAFRLSLMGVALILTFLRSYWVVLILVFALLPFLFKGNERKRLLQWSLAALCFISLALILITGQTDSRATSLINASTDRLGTLGRSGTFQGQDGSLNWRMIENQYALSTIMAHPWLGLGMGFTYRPWDPRLDRPLESRSSLDFRTFIHNGHLWILLQSGLIGYLSFLWLSVTFIYRGFRHWRNISINQYRGVVLGFSLVYVAVMIAAAINSTFNEWYWTPVIGVMMGMSETILINFRNKEVTA